ncbi:4-alpha-glucanotransferase [Akkermansiaceae bacterium]|nr:4-alpha-glucanotransferase [Akkermansiaceae bacterium]
MTLVFRVAYRTVVGESLWLEMDGGQVPMRWLDEGHWEVEVESPAAQVKYNYLLKREGYGVELREWGGVRDWHGGSNLTEELEVSSPSISAALRLPPRVLFLDDWRSAGSDDRVYEAKVFAAVEGNPGKPGKFAAKGKNHEFCLHMARVPKGLVPCLMGGFETLGDWDYGRAVPMLEAEKNIWKAGVELPADWRVEYKYGLYDPALGKAVRLEDGGNRVLERRDGAGQVFVSDENFRRGADLKFRGAGVAIPVFSLRSAEGCGVGEFADLKAMGDWAAATGLKMLQILPINDTTSSKTWTDSYPYSAISVFALHPIYLRLDEMSFPMVGDADFAEERISLNALQHVDYEAVMAVKWRVTREIFDTNHDAILRDKAFLGFLERNRDWVLDYAIFSVKRDEHGTADFSKWGEWAEYDAAKAESLSISTDSMYYVWLQYELDRQLTDAVAHLHAAGVALKGDLPIGVDRDSVDAWVAPHLFNMNAQAGAPPDAFAVKGQNWGFPTYNWDEMKKDGYAWWRARFEKLSRYFDAYRIDHILGFFRIWQVPVEQVEGIMGWFDPAMPIRVEEFAERGIAFDYDRFCKPIVFEKDLAKKFGEFADGVRQDFLVDYGLGCHGPKPQFSTQRQVAEFFGKLGNGDWANKEWLRDALMDVVAEVLFLEVPGSGGTEFHPRMSMMDTDSFKALDWEMQDKLRALYVDYFFRRQEGFWEAKAYEKLPAMRAASDMLLCGEDLGMVPACVPGVMRELGMLSLEIQRWPKEEGVDFAHPAHAPYMSVVSTGTHDMETLRAWWRDDGVIRANFAWEMFGEGYPEKDLSPEMARRIIAQQMHSPAMWAVFPLQDLLAMDGELRSNDIDGERINVPAIIPFYWRWRMEMAIADMLDADDFTTMIRGLAQAAGRSIGKN